MITSIERSVMPSGFTFSEKIEPAKLTLEEMQDVLARPLIGNVWVAFQNHDMGSRELGKILLLRIGPSCSIQMIPKRAPDAPARLMKEGKGWGLGWRWLPIGFVDPQTGDIHPE